MSEVGGGGGIESELGGGGGGGGGTVSSGGGGGGRSESMVEWYAYLDVLRQNSEDVHEMAISKGDKPSARVMWL